MNKKGYTLIEILIVIAIISTVGIVATISLNQVMSNSKQEQYNNLVQDIKLSANTFLTIYEKDESVKNPYNDDIWSSELSKLYNNSGYSICIYLSTLQEALLLEENLKDPRNNKIIDPEKTKVVIKYESNQLSFKLGDEETVCYSGEELCNNAPTSCGSSLN